MIANVRMAPPVNTTTIHPPARKSRPGGTPFRGACQQRLQSVNGRDPPRKGKARHAALRRVTGFPAKQAAGRAGPAPGAMVYCWFCCWLAQAALEAFSGKVQSTVPVPVALPVAPLLAAGAAGGVVEPVCSVAVPSIWSA